MTTPIKEIKRTARILKEQLKNRKESESSLNGLLGCEPRLNAQIKVLLEMERTRVHEWYGHRLKALEEWARKQEQPTREAVFGCLANGSPLHERTGYAAQLNSLKHALEKSEKEVLELRAKVAELEAT